MLKDEIKAKLTEAGVPFDEDMKKEELLQLMEENNINEVEKDTSSTEEVNEAEEPQKKYVVIQDFKDLKDNNVIYIKGDIYPRRADAVIDEERIKELSSTNNKMGKVLIKEQD